MTEQSSLGAIYETIGEKARGQLYVNVKSDTVIITEDKARLILIEYIQDLGAEKDWQTPTALLVTLVVTLVTTSFRDFIVSKEVWNGAFWVATLLDILWVLQTVRRAKRAPGIDQIIGEMKTASPVTPDNSGSTTEPTRGAA